MRNLLMCSFRRISTVCLLPVLALGILRIASVDAQTLDPAIPYVPTPERVVTLMLKMGKAESGDVHYDLGSGDGRLVIAAVRDFNVKKSVGVDINPRRIREGRENARKADVADKITFIQGDLFDQDLTGVDVLTLYLSPEVNRMLRPKILAEMSPGTRVVSHDFRMGDWKRDAFHELGKSDIYMWVVPADVDGAWRGTADEHSLAVDFRQEYQNLTGLLEFSGQRVPLQGRLEGSEIRFDAVLTRSGEAKKLQFTGRVSDGTMKGCLEMGDESWSVVLQPLG